MDAHGAASSDSENAGSRDALADLIETWWEGEEAPTMRYDGIGHLASASLADAILGSDWLADREDLAKVTILQRMAAQAEQEGAPDHVVTWLRSAALTYRGHVHKRHGGNLLDLLDDLRKRGELPRLRGLTDER